MQNENLRQAVEAVERELSTLSRNSRAGSTPSLDGLTIAWSSLVKAIDLEPAHRPIECPHCHRMETMAATRCGYCWAMLSPTT
jgi:hypothetical protein